MAVIGFVLVLVWLFSGPQSGVKLKNEVDEYAMVYLEDKKILTKGENLLAYYDVTMSMDGTEAAILTDQRIIYHRNGRNDVIALKNIADIHHRKEPLIGDIMEIYAVSGASMKIEVAPLNQGETFLTALTSAWEKAKSQATESDGAATPAQSDGSQ